MWGTRRCLYWTTVVFLTASRSLLGGGVDPPAKTSDGLLVAKGIDWLEVSPGRDQTLRFEPPASSDPHYQFMIHAMRHAPVGAVVRITWLPDGAVRRVVRVAVLQWEPPPPPDKFRDGKVYLDEYWMPIPPAADPPSDAGPPLQSPPPAAQSPEPSPPANQPQVQRYGQPFEGQEGWLIGRVFEKGGDCISIQGVEGASSQTVRFKALDIEQNGRMVPDPCMLDAIRQIQPGRMVTVSWAYHDGLRITHLSAFVDVLPLGPAQFIDSWPGPHE